ncbi:hypothetical protein CEE37_03880 [candidate division LCP-89 bacterium B3_LCP]|uniref:CAAX prenyl protease 2/Lysostaphin resistance protein A-like domain-containing protein n=1 Tax=candidate division LCP-89 bacterium B3_LCP TaxID=2012998 RepID=A0A532V3C2_UNCL8|nr:MAG: hypothetical protein CEE37_03880 [candidate division LCP-89 bacterium B3_LCP]
MDNFLEPTQPNQNGEDKPRRYYPPPNEAFLVLAATLVMTMIFGAILVTNSGRVGLFMTELLFIFPPIIYLQVKKYDLKRCLRLNKVPLPQLFTSLIIGVALVVFLDEVDRIMNLIFPMPAEVQQALMDFVTLDSWSDYLIVGGGTVFIAAICEESLFRGFMQVSMEAFGSVTKAVLFGALLFALAHFNPWWMLQIVLLGVILGYISWRTNSIFPCMLIHAVHNAIALSVSGSLEGEGWEWYSSGTHVSPEILIFAGALLFLGFKLLIRQTEHTFPSGSDSDETTTA